MPEELQKVAASPSPGLSPEDATTETSVEAVEAVTPSENEAVCEAPPEPEDISPNKDRGILKTIIRPGEGVALPDDGVKVKVYYKAKLLDGTEFDNNETRSEEGKPYECELGSGAGMQIKAWDICIASMKKKEIASFKCRSRYAYEHFGYPPKVPEYTTIVIEIELVSWDNDMTTEKDGGVLKTVLVNGDGDGKPREGSLVDVHITGEYKGKVFEDRDVLFTLGEGSAYGVCEGIEMGLASFRENETSRLEIKWMYSKDAVYKEKAKIPFCEQVVYTITLKSFRTVKSVWNLSPGDRLKYAEKAKEEGTKYYKDGMYAIAAKIYKRIEDYVSRIEYKDEEDQLKQWELIIAMHMNMALSYLKLNEGKQAKEHCDKVLEREPKNVKALFRRGQCYMNLREPDSAIEDFEQVLKLEPYNNAAINNIQRCKIMRKKVRSSVKSMYGSMFKNSDKNLQEGDT